MPHTRPRIHRTSGSSWWSSSTRAVPRKIWLKKFESYAQIWCMSAIEGGGTSC